jgi:hypothetical protein
MTYERSPWEWAGTVATLFFFRLLNRLLVQSSETLEGAFLPFRCLAF